MQREEAVTNADADAARGGVRVGRIDHRSGKPVLFHGQAFWAEHLERQRASGLALPAYCVSTGTQISSGGDAAENLDLLSSDPQASAMFERTARAQRDLDPGLVIPADVAVQRRGELLDGRGQPVARVEPLVFQAAEETLARGVVRRARFARHRANELCLCDPGQPARPAVVAATIRMNHGPSAAVGDGCNGSVQHRVD